jgi:hypothetical protein
MFDFWAPRLLARAAPDAKILVLLRDPVLRYVSGLTVELGEGAPPFHPSVAQDALARGFYCDQLSRVLDVYPREQVLVLQHEACVRDVLGELARTYGFLGLDPEFVPPAARARVNPTEAKVTVSAETREVLRELYRSDVLRLRVAFPEIDLALWPNYAELT